MEKIDKQEQKKLWESDYAHYECLKVIPNLNWSNDMKDDQLVPIKNPPPLATKVILSSCKYEEELRKKRMEYLSKKKEPLTLEDFEEAMRAIPADYGI